MTAAPSRDAPSILSCPSCGGPIAFGTPFCVYCRGPLTWGSIPLLNRGRLIAHIDATRDVLPRKIEIPPGSEIRGPQGVQITVGPAKAFNGEVALPRRHGCIVVRATAVDPNAGVGVVARRHAQPGACGYALIAVPFYRVIDYTRYVATSVTGYTDDLKRFEFHPGVAPLGQPNEIELRCADSIHQIFINGHHVGACIDATFGFGGFGWRLESMDTRPARAIFHSVSLYTVA